MGEQRSTFRFRLPWSLPSAAPSRRPRATTTQTTTTADETTKSPAAKRIPSRTPSRAAAQPPPPQPQTPPKDNSQTPITTSPTTTIENPLPQAQSSPKTESDPSSPSPAGSQTRISSQPSSPSRSRTQSRVTPQPPSPSRGSPQSRAASQPPAPLPASSQPRAASQPPSPSRVFSQTQSTSQPSSPTRPLPQKSPQTIRQPPSPSGQTSSIPSSSHVQPTGGTATRHPSPSKNLNPIQESSHPHPSSDKHPSPISEEEQNQAVSQLQSPEAQPKTEPSGQIAASEPTTPVVKEIPSPQMKSDSIVICDFPKSQTNSDGNLLEPRKMDKEMEQNPTALANEIPKQKIVADHLSEASGSTEHTKEQPKVSSQAGEKHLENQEMVSKKEVSNTKTSILDGKQTKTTISHQKDKSISHQKDKSKASESRHRLVVPNGGRVSLQKEIRDEVSKLTHKMANPDHHIEGKPVSVITLIGENRGASMQLGSEAAEGGGPVHINRGYKINPDESVEATTDGEESYEGRRSKDANAEEDQVMKSFINSNIQSINNSILFDSFITENNPGVHLDLSRNQAEHIKSTESVKACKAEVNITPSKKLTYEPTIRRRCLRGLFMEPSVSETDNPDKPRRHGCRYSCPDKNNDKEIDVL